MMALLPAATVAKPAWSERMLLPSAFSPKIWVIVPVGSPPSVSVSSALQPVGMRSMLTTPPLGQRPTLDGRRKYMHGPPSLGRHGRRGHVSLGLQPFYDLLQCFLGEFGGEVGD